MELPRPAHQISGAVKSCVACVIASVQELESDRAIGDVTVCSSILFQGQCEWNDRSRWSVGVQALAGSVDFFGLISAAI